MSLMKIALSLLLLSIAAPLHAGFWGHSPVSTVEAGGTGSVQAAATEAEATVTVLSEDKTAAAVNDALAKNTATLLAFLKQNGKARDIATQAVEISPRYEYVNGAQKAAGYQGRIAVHFKAPAGGIGELISGALRNGATQSDGYNAAPNEADLQVARRQAIDLAVKDALWQARATLESAGVVEKAIRKITVSTGEAGPRPMPMMKFAAAAPASLPVEAGTREVTANATVVLEFTAK